MAIPNLNESEKNDRPEEVQLGGQNGPIAGPIRETVSPQTPCF